MGSGEIPPNIITNKVRTAGATWGVLGDADGLRAAYQSGQPVTVARAFDGEVIYLSGLDRVIGPSPKFPGHTIACYTIDLSRLDAAPLFADAERAARNASMARVIALETRARTEEHRMIHDSEDGA